MATLKLQSNRRLYSNTVIGTLAICCYIWCSEEGPERAAAPPSPVLAVTKCNSPPINGQCTNFILFDVATITASEF